VWGGPFLGGRVVACQTSELKARVENLIMNSGGIRVVLEG
jgi:hypothetical protein